MRLFTPRVLWLFLPLWALLPFIWYFIERSAANRLSRFASPALLKIILRGADPVALAARRRTRFIFGLLGLFCVLLALSRPQMGVREESIPSEGLDMVFLLDVSNSMLTEDVVPNRLKKAKHVIRNFIDRLGGDRAGVVAFAGSAYPAVPLTTDYDFLRQTLDVLDEGSISNQGTDLGAGLEVARDLLLRGGLAEDDDPARQQATDERSSRVIIILSDGESHEGEETRVVPSLKERGIRVFSIGVGSNKGGPIPLRDPTGYMRGYKKDRQSNMILTKLESANLESIASKTDGKYYTASGNEGEVEEIFGQLSTMTRAPGAGRRVIVYDEMFQYPLALGIVLLLIMLGLRDGPRKREEATELAPETKSASTAAPPAALAILVLLSSVSLFERNARAESLNEYRNTRRGVDAYNDKDFPTAIQEFGKAQASNPEAASHHMNLGDALLKAGSVDGAVNEFQAAVKSKNASESGRGAFNLGKTYEQTKDYEKALRALQGGLDRLADDPKSDPEVEERIKRALEITMQNKQKQEQQKQDQSGGGGQGQDKEGKDKQDQNQGQGQDKDDKGNAKKDEGKKYEVGKRKPQFKDEKISESDASRVMKQMQEQEKKSQQRVMRARTGKPKDDKISKDW